MKAKIVSKEKAFEPFDLVISVETKREAEFLLGLFSIAPIDRIVGEINNDMGFDGDDSFAPDEVDTNGIWQALDEKIDSI